MKINIRLEVLSFEKGWDVIQRDIIKKPSSFPSEIADLSVTECYRVKTRSG